MGRYSVPRMRPGWFDSDGLLMQRIRKRPDWESIQIHFDRAKQILHLVKEDWEIRSGLCEAN